MRRLVDAFHATHEVAEHAIAGFDRFMDVHIRKIIEDTSTLSITHEGVTHRLAWDRVRIAMPHAIDTTTRRPYSVGPRAVEGTTRSYTNRVYVRLHHHTMRGEELLATHVHDPHEITQVPCMVRSAYCHTRRPGAVDRLPGEHGGFFIVNGKRRVLVSQIQLRSNMLHHWTKKGTTTIEYRSAHPGRWRSTSTLVWRKERGRPATVRLPFVWNAAKKPLCGPLACLLARLGLAESEQPIEAWLDAHGCVHTYPSTAKFVDYVMELSLIHI